MLSVPADELDPRGFGRKELECAVLASGGWKEGEELKSAERRIRVELMDEWGETVVQTGPSLPSFGDIRTTSLGLDD